MKKTILCKFISSISIIAFLLVNLYYYQHKEVSCADIVNLPLTNHLPLIGGSYLAPIRDNNVGAGLAPAQLPLMRGLSLDPNNPSKIKFYFNSRDKSNIAKKDIKRMIRYFLGFLAMPNDKLWVNLSPYEKDRIMPDSLSQLDIGKDMLLEDYLLKQLTTFLINPSNIYGKKFWEEIYKISYKLAGTYNIPIETFNKIWIIPGKTVVYNKDNLYFIQEAKLKVMMENDYFGIQNNHSHKSEYAFMKRKKKNNYKIVEAGLAPALLDKINKKVREIFKQQIFPIIEKEINNSENFAPLRQLYCSLVLANCFKERFPANSFYRNYINREKNRSISLKNYLKIKNIIYNAYLNSAGQTTYQVFKNNYLPGLSKKRKYFIGGAKLQDLAIEMTNKYFATTNKMLTVEVEMNIDSSTFINNVPSNEVREKHYRRKLKQYNLAKLNSLEQDFNYLVSKRQHNIPLCFNLEGRLIKIGLVNDEANLYEVFLSLNYDDLGNYRLGEVDIPTILASKAQELNEVIKVFFQTKEAQVLNNEYILPELTKPYLIELEKEKFLLEKVEAKYFITNIDNGEIVTKTRKIIFDQKYNQARLVMVSIAGKETNFYINFIKQPNNTELRIIPGKDKKSNYYPLFIREDAANLNYTADLNVFYDIIKEKDPDIQVELFLVGALIPFLNQALAKPPSDLEKYNFLQVANYIDFALGERILKILDARNINNYNYGLGLVGDIIASINEYLYTAKTHGYYYSNSFRQGSMYYLLFWTDRGAAKIQPVKVTAIYNDKRADGWFRHYYIDYLKLFSLKFYYPKYQYLLSSYNQGGLFDSFLGVTEENHSYSPEPYYIINSFSIVGQSVRDLWQEINDNPDMGALLASFYGQGYNSEDAINEIERLIKVHELRHVEDIIAQSERNKWTSSKTELSADMAAMIAASIPLIGIISLCYLPALSFLKHGPTIPGHAFADFTLLEMIINKSLKQENELIDNRKIFFEIIHRIIIERLFSKYIQKYKLDPLAGNFLPSFKDNIEAKESTSLNPIDEHIIKDYNFFGGDLYLRLACYDSPIEVSFGNTASSPKIILSNQQGKINLQFLNSQRKSMILDNSCNYYFIRDDPSTRTWQQFQSGQSFMNEYIPINDSFLLENHLELKVNGNLIMLKPIGKAFIKIRKAKSSFFKPGGINFSTKLNRNNLSDLTLKKSYLFNDFAEKSFDINYDITNIKTEDLVFF